MGFLDKVKNFAGGASMVKVEFLDIELAILFFRPGEINADSRFALSTGRPANDRTG